MEEINHWAKKIKIKDYDRTQDYVEQHPGRVTGSIKNPVEMPIEWLIKLPGLRAEHLQLEYDMPKIKKLSKLVQDEKFRKEHPIELEVHHNNKVFIFDGSHRVRAAKLADLPSYPCKFSFYGGSEETFDPNKILKQYPIKKEALDMSKPDNKIVLFNSLMEKAKLAVKAGLNHDEVIQAMYKLAGESDGVGGATDVSGDPVNQEYQALSDYGNDEAGENDPDKGNTALTGPRNLGDVKARLIDSIKSSNALYSQASHVEQIEIPLKDLHLDEDVDYRIFAHEQTVFSSVAKYLQTHVFNNKKHFTIVRIEQEGKKLFADVLVFDRQIAHESNIKNTKFVKNAWKLRLTQSLGDNDQTGLVSCPIEGNNLVRSCGSCPLAANPHTYVVDGYVDCRYDEISSWLSGGGVKEHQPKDNSSSA